MGKSTLFNRLIGKKIAIVHDTPGVTRDRNYGEAEWNGKKFFLIDTGGYVPDSKDKFEAAIREQVKISIEEADLILFDSPPTLLMSDAATLSGRVDGTILVNDSGSTRTTETRRAADELRKVHANLVGAVLNRISRRSGGYYYSYYYSGYAHDTVGKVNKKKKRS